MKISSLMINDAVEIRGYKTVSYVVLSLYTTSIYRFFVVHISSLNGTRAKPETGKARKKYQSVSILANID